MSVELKDVELKDKDTGRSPLRRIFRRGPWENLATVLIGLGVVMLMQPISIDLYTYSLDTTLAGTLMFMIVTKFPD